MIYELAFRNLLDQAEQGQSIRALFITPTHLARTEQQFDMLDMANERDFHPMFHVKDRHITFLDCTVVIRIAHPYLDRELRGWTWNQIHGLEYLEEFAAGERIAQELKSRTPAIRTSDDVS